MPLERLLALLADGCFHSGEELGQQLSMSRAAVWKQLRKLSALGLALESQRGVGHRVLGGLDLLNPTALRAVLSAAAAELMTALEMPLVVDSTSARLMARANTGEPIHGVVISAEQQLAGRGRRGRQWVSPFARNIYLSVGWAFDGGAAALEGLSLAVGVAVVRALEPFGVVGLRLKWPNDILLAGRKLAGILIDMTGDAAGRCQVVVGIGVNVAMPVDAGAGIDQAWTDLRTVGVSAPRVQILASVLKELLPLLSNYERNGFAAWRDAWSRLDACAQQPIVLLQGQRYITGIACGVDLSGALLVDTESGRQVFNGGEVSLRLSG